jgi:hypothetical protein
MYDHQNLTKNMFLPLKQYITKIKALYPYDSTDSSISFYTEDPYFSHFQIFLDKTSFGYELSFIGENSNITSFIFEFSEEITLNIEQVINGDFVERLNDISYQIKILPRGFSLDSQLNENVRVSQYIFSLDATTMNLHEMFSENNYESTLFYKCSSCGGEILRAMFDNKEENYYVGSDQRRVNDKEFFQQANMWYLSPLLGLIAGTISMNEESQEWPKSE